MNKNMDYYLMIYPFNFLNIFYYCYKDTLKATLLLDK